jgi:hypothetical protein
MGENLESFEHWKQMIALMCNCDAGLRDPILSKELFFRLIPVLYEQFRQLPRDFFTDDLSKVSFIADALYSLFLSCCEPACLNIPKNLRARVQKLKEMLFTEYGFRPRVTLE